MLGNVESTIYAFSTNKWPQMWPQEQIEWATGNLLLDSRDQFRERSGSYQSVAEVDPKPSSLAARAPRSTTSITCQEQSTTEDRRFPVRKVIRPQLETGGPASLLLRNCGYGQQVVHNTWGRRVRVARCCHDSH